jgi:phosphoglycolate phosphatase
MTPEKLPQIGSTSVQPEAILFDLDGTLLDSLPGITFAVHHAFEQCSLPIPQADIRSYIGPPIRSILSKLAGGISPTTLDQLEQSFRAIYDAEGWRRTPHYPDAIATLHTMRAHNIRLFVVSNKPIHAATLILQAAGTFELFDAILTRDCAPPHYADKIAMIQHLISTHHLDPNACLMVGDTMEDAYAASQIPMRFVFMTHGYGDIPESDTIPVAMRLNHFSNFLPKLIKEFAR